MSTHDITQDRGATAAHGRPARPERCSDRRPRPRPRLRRTEFYAFLAVLVGLLVAGNTIEGKDGGADYFAADTLLTIGYMISRGLAKAGSRDPYASWLFA